MEAAPLPLFAWDAEQAPTEPPELVFTDDGDIALSEIDDAGEGSFAVPLDPVADASAAPDPTSGGDPELVPMNRGDLGGVPEEGGRLVGGPAKALKIIDRYTPELVIVPKTGLADLFLEGCPPGMDLTHIQQVRRGAGGFPIALLASRRPSRAYPAVPAESLTRFSLLTVHSHSGPFR